MNKTDLNALRDRAYKTACEHGFHDKELSDEHCLCLVIAELMEAVEADRKGIVADLDAFNKYEGRTTFEYNFERHIKDSVADELADSAIRLLDLAGLRKIDMNDRFIIAYIVNKKKSFTENIYAILKDIVNYRYSFEECFNYSIRQIFELAQIEKIDLSWYIDQKMKYNESRPRMHGKRY